ncbi:MAG: hypothetical protein Kow00127_23850 [Bacteroidales bacterium]
MKRLILLSALSLFLLGAVNSQDLQALYGDEVLTNTSVITLQSHPDSGMVSLHDIGIKNGLADPILVSCARKIVELVPGSVNSFCWGLCYPPSVDTATQNIKIEAGETSWEFSADHDPKGNTGVSTIQYTFWETGNPDRFVTFMVKFDITESMAVAEKPFEPALKSFPNPADRFVQFEWDAGQYEKPRIVIYNLLGRVVKEIQPVTGTGSEKIDTSDLTDGIYFSSLLINNESVITQKLIIKH